MSTLKETSVSTTASPDAAFDIILFITRAQPFHLGHKSNIDKALTYGKRVVVIVGSVGIARDTRNPFTFEERKKMILDTYNNDPRITVMPLRDHPYNDTMWASYVQKLVNDVTEGNKNVRIGLIGHRKEDTGYYLDMFPQWRFIESGIEADMDFDATSIRKAFFEQRIGTPFDDDGIMARVPTPVVNFMTSFMMDGENRTPEYERLLREYIFLKKHGKSWENAPYTPIFSTVDSIVIQSGHILLIKRKSAPGEGLWAIPGGYLEPSERILDGMIRELAEETKLKVPKDVIRGSIVDQQVFDYPRRSLRGRIVTHAFCVLLKNGPLPKIKAASDAKKAEWVPLSDFYQMQDQMFEDHFYIIDHFVSKLKDIKR